MRSGEALQIMGAMRSIVLDKTGTITRGEPRVQRVVVAVERSEDDILRTRPRPSRRANIDWPGPSRRGRRNGAWRSACPWASCHIPAKGWKPGWRARACWSARLNFLAERGIELAAVREQVSGLEECGLTVVGVARDGALWGAIGIGDAINSDSADAIRHMKDAGMTPVMITGDRRRVHAVAQRSAAGGQGGRGPGTTGAGPAGGDGGRRHQRRPRPYPSDLGIAIGAGTAERLGALVIRRSDVVVNMPFLTWPGGNADVGARRGDEVRE